MKPGRTSDERQFHKYPLNVSKTPILLSGPHPSAHVMPADNLVMGMEYIKNFNKQLPFVELFISKREYLKR